MSDGPCAVTLAHRGRLPLTDRELEVLRAARGGASVNEIAAEIPLAPGIVRNSLSAAMSKLQAPRRRPPRLATRLDLTTYPCRSNIESGVAERSDARVRLAAGYCRHLGPAP
ncbi:LuxR C-terminal-related transcriptional regulator [Spirillospora sp. CA-255316]